MQSIEIGTTILTSKDLKENSVSENTVEMSCPESPQSVSSISSDMTFEEELELERQENYNVELQSKRKNIHYHVKTLQNAKIYKGKFNQLKRKYDNDPNETNERLLRNHRTKSLQFFSHLNKEHAERITDLKSILFYTHNWHSEIKNFKLKPHKAHSSLVNFK